MTEANLNINSIISAKEESDFILGWHTIKVLLSHGGYGKLLIYALFIEAGLDKEEADKSILVVETLTLEQALDAWRKEKAKLN